MSKESDENVSKLAKQILKVVKEGDPSGDDTSKNPRKKYRKDQYVVDGKVYRVQEIHLQSGVDFDLCSNIQLDRESTIAKLTVPKDCIYLYSQPVGHYGDWYSPRVYGRLYRKKMWPFGRGALLERGVVRFRIFSSDGSYVVGTPLSVGVAALNACDPIDLNKRLYFNCSSKLKATEECEVRITLSSSQRYDPKTSDLGFTVMRLLRVV